MKINFNTLGLASGGGNRVIIEIANRLADRGHDVTITAITLDKFEWYGKENIKAKLNTAFPSIITRLIRQRVRHENYFDVQTDLLKKISPDCDINIATFCLTVKPTIESNKGKPFYLVQNYEPWFFKEPKWIKIANDSYNLPATKLCVSHWLQEKTGGEYIGDGVNTEVFKPQCPFTQKEPNSVLYFYRGIAAKQDDLALECLSKLYEDKKAKIHIVAQNNFSNSVNPAFPFELHVDPPDIELAKLYSSMRILLFTSLYEGFGLPPLEALACGTNVVSTAFIGNEFLLDKENCFLGKTKDELVSHAIELLENDELSKNQITNGKKTVNDYSFDKVIVRVESVFKKKFDNIKGHLSKG
jgi:glycosyltransferase involved in cell wall biosynthesis